MPKQPAVELDPSAWRAYAGADFPERSWAAEDGVLHALAGSPRLDLVSRLRYGDFELRFEWRVAPGGNSGVLYRVDESAAAAWQSGPEMQLLDDRMHPDGRTPQTSSGALYGVVPSRPKPPCRAGVFNTARVLVLGGHVEHWLNGTRVMVCDLASEDFRSRVARSKFADFPQFARAPEGHLVLQHHGDEAWFRNLRVTLL